MNNTTQQQCCPLQDLNPQQLAKQEASGDRLKYSAKRAVESAA